MNMPVRAYPLEHMKIRYYEAEPKHLNFTLSYNFSRAELNVSILAA